MIFTHVLFYVFSCLAILGALSVVFMSNPVHAALALVGTFFCMAAVWVILQAQFLGIILVLVYVGAVMTLFLFVLMMVNVQTEGVRGYLVRFTPVLVLVMVCVFLLILNVVLPRYLGLFPAPLTENYNNITPLGLALFTDYVYPLELAGVILLVGMIAAMSLAHRGPRSRKTQEANTQLRASKASRLRIVSQKSEKPHG